MAKSAFAGPAFSAMRKAQRSRPGRSWRREERLGTKEENRKPCNARGPTSNDLSVLSVVSPRIVSQNRGGRRNKEISSRALLPLSPSSRLRRDKPLKPASGFPGESRHLITSPMEEGGRPVVTKTCQKGKRAFSIARLCFFVEQAAAAPGTNS